MSLRKQSILLFCILMFCYSYVHQGMGWNQNSRLDLLHALFVHKTFKIDAYHENTGDKSIQDGHYYSDKAPGIVFLALPAFAVSIAILRSLDVPLDSAKGWLASSWITTVGSVGLITALGGVAMFAFLCRLVGQCYAFVTTLVVFLGAAPFPYATMLFSHAAVIGLICIALWAISDEITPPATGKDQATGYRLPSDISPLQSDGRWIEGEGNGARGPGSDQCPTPSVKRYLLAGLCCGLAIASEYTAATAAGGVLLLAFLSGPKRAFCLALAAVPALLLIPAYNWACFGSAIAFGYHHLARPEFQGMNNGLFGITFPPKASSAYLILLSPARGLFFWTPFLVMSFFGFKEFFAISRKLFSISCLAIVLQVICISGYYMPSGGAALGPRHLAPILPFASIAAALGLRRFPNLGALLGFYSIIFSGIGTLITAMPPDHRDPLLAFYLPRLFAGEFAKTVTSQIGLPTFASLSIVVGAMFVPFICASFLSPDSPPGRLNAK